MKEVHTLRIRSTSTPVHKTRGAHTFYFRFLFSSFEKLPFARLCSYTSFFWCRGKFVVHTILKWKKWARVRALKRTLNSQKIYFFYEVKEKVVRVLHIHNPSRVCVSLCFHDQRGGVSPFTLLYIHYTSDDCRRSKLDNSKVSLRDF